MSDERFSVCLLVGTTEVQDWFATALDRMITQTNASVSLVCLADTTLDEPEQNTQQGVADQLKHRIREVLVRRIMGKTYSEKRVSIDSVPSLEGADFITCKTREDGIRKEVPTDTVKQIDGQCDLVLHLGVGILTGDILSAGTHGVAGYHGGDLRRYRGGPPAFWEYLHDTPEIGMTLQLYNESLDGGDVLVESHRDISEAKSWGEIQKIQHEAAMDMLATAVERLQDPQFTPTSLSSEELGPVYSKSDITASVITRYIIKEIKDEWLHSNSRS